MTSHDNDPDLLYDVEMSPYYDEGADGAGGGVQANANPMGRHLQRDGSGDQARRPANAA